jgi:DNA ligase (NAD+)
MTDLEKLSIEQLAAQIEYHNRKYWEEAEPEISDDEYDQLVRRLTELAPDHPLLQTIQAPAVASSGKVIHRDPMLSLDKAYSLDEVISWASKFVRSDREEFLVQPKYDGISASWSGGILATRGDGETGENITDKVPLIELEHPAGIMPLGEFKGQARGEIVIRADDFRTLYPKIMNRNGRPYKNSRNAAAGIMGLKDISLMLLQHAKLTLVDYSLHSWKTTWKDFRADWQDLVDRIEQLPYPMDGIVIKLADQAYSRSLGNTAHHPRGQIAFKFSGVRQQSKLLKVEWSFGKTALTPVAEIEPVEITGTTIRHVTLHNLQNILDHDIQIGDTVTVERAGDVIPYIVESQPGETRTPCVIENCPSCGAKLVRELPELRCVNPDCPETQLMRLLAAVKNIGIERLGEPNLRRMREVLGVKNLKDIFNLTVPDIMRLEGFQELSANNLYKEIQAARTAPDYQLLASLNIKGIGPNIAKAILKTNTLKELEGMNAEQLANLEGIGPERAGAIEKELRERKAEIDELLECLTIVQTKSDSAEERPTVCFTGKMPEKRSYYENLAKANGYDSADSVTSSLSLLVTAEADSTSSKAVKAAKLGVKVMTLADWLKTLNGKETAPAPKAEDDLFSGF